MRIPVYAKSPNNASRPNGADQTELLADDREDEVVVRVGQIVPLGRALPQTVAEHTAVGQRVLAPGGPGTRSPAGPGPGSSHDRTRSER